MPGAPALREQLIERGEAPRVEADALTETRRRVDALTDREVIADLGGHEEDFEAWLASSERSAAVRKSRRAQTMRDLRSQPSPTS